MITASAAAARVAPSPPLGRGPGLNPPSSGSYIERDSVVLLIHVQPPLVATGRQWETRHVHDERGIQQTAVWQAGWPTNLYLATRLDRMLSAVLSCDHYRLAVLV